MGKQNERLDQKLNNSQSLGKDDTLGVGKILISLEVIKKSLVLCF